MNETDKLAIYIRPGESIVNVWVDADFRSNWFPEEATDDSDTARFSSEFFLSELVFPVMRKSQFQT